jgi:hypothetical protein
MDNDTRNPFDPPELSVVGEEPAEEPSHDDGHGGHGGGHHSEHPGCVRLGIPLFGLAILLITMCYIIFRVAGGAIYGH